MAEALARQVKQCLHRGIKERGIASLAVPGGMTPQRFFKALYRRFHYWEKLHVTLTDERWVDTSHDASNEKQVREYLLARKAKFIGFKNSALTPEEGEAETEKALLAVPRPFDAVVLGMGEDGHTVSLFPDAPPETRATGLSLDSNRLCIATRSAGAPYPRLSMTVAGILQSRHIFLLIIGENKKKAYTTALGPGACEAMPIRAILHQGRVPVSVYWSP